MFNYYGKLSKFQSLNEDILTNQLKNLVYQQIFLFDANFKKIFLSMPNYCNISCYTSDNDATGMYYNCNDNNNNNNNNGNIIISFTIGQQGLFGLASKQIVDKV